MGNDKVWQLQEPTDRESWRVMPTIKLTDAQCEAIREAISYHNERRDDDLREGFISDSSDRREMRRLTRSLDRIWFKLAEAR